MYIRYVLGNVEYCFDNGPKIFQKGKTFAGPGGQEMQQFESDVNDERFSDAGIAKDCFLAVKDLPSESTEPARFDLKKATIDYNGEVYTPDTYTDITEADVKAFAEAIYTYNNGEQAKVYEALQMDIIEPEREPEPLTPEQEKELARKQIIQDFDNGVKALTSGYTDNEVKSWYAKRRESEIILSGSGEPTPTVDAICQGLGADRTEYANRINQKAQAYGAAYGALEAKMKLDLAALEE